MVVRYQERFQEMMAQAEVSPDAMRGLLDRLETFVHPSAPRWELDRATTAPPNTSPACSRTSSTRLPRGSPICTTRIASRCRSSSVALGPSALLVILAEQVGQRLGEPDGVIVFDPSAFAKKGDKSVGVARQWCGRLGKVENCQVGVYMGYVSRIEHALVKSVSILPEEWAKDRPGARRRACPRRSGSRPATNWPWRCSTRAAPSCRTPGSPGTTRWAGRSDFRRELRGLRRAIPAGGAVEHADPRPGGRTAGVFREGAASQESVHAGGRSGPARLPEGAWTRIEVRDGEKGPLVVEVVKRRVQARTETGGRGRRSCCSSPVNFKRIGRTSMITISRTPTRRRRWPNWRGWPRRSIASRNAWSEPRGRRAWPTTR